MSRDADLLRLGPTGEVRVLLEDEDGQFYEPVEPGAPDDPFTVLHDRQSISSVLTALRHHVVTRNQAAAERDIDALIDLTDKLRKEEEDASSNQPDSPSR